MTEKTSGHFFIEEGRMKDVLTKLAEFGQKEGFSPAELSIVLSLASAWIAEEIGLKLNTVEKLNLLADN